MSQTPPPPSPSVPGFDDPFLVPEPPAWPKVIGIISICWGSLGVVCTGCGIAGLGMQKWAMDQAAASGQNIPKMPDVLMPGTAQYVLMGIGALFAIFLIIAGIATLKRTPMGRTLHLAYGVAGLIIVAISIVIGIQHAAAAAQFYKDHPDDPSKQYYSPMGMMVSLGFQLLIGAAWPVFSIVWFGLIKRRHEDMLAPPATPGASV